MAKQRATKIVLAIDPGLQGAFILFNGVELKSWPMPLILEGKDKYVNFDGVHEILTDVRDGNGPIPIFLERAVSFGMGTKGAFNYGRGFAAIEIAIALVQMPVTYVEPGKWTKEMHSGISGDLKPKAKSLIAVKRLFPKLVESLPKGKKGKILDGPIDALLIAAYGLNRVTPQRSEPEYDFM